MKNNILLYLTIVLLLLSQFWLINQKKDLGDEIQLKDSYMERLVSTNNSLQTQFTSMIDNCSFVLDGNCLLKDTANNAISLADLASTIKSNILICRYTEGMCHECVVHTVSVIIDNQDSIDSKHTVFIAGNSSRRVTKLNIKEMDINGYRVLNCPNLGIPAEEAMFPYIMAVDSSLRVLSVYFPTKSTHGTDYDYRHVKYMYDKLIR